MQQQQKRARWQELRLSAEETSTTSNQQPGDGGNKENKQPDLSPKSQSTREPTDYR